MGSDQTLSSPSLWVCHQANWLTIFFIDKNPIAATLTRPIRPVTSEESSRERKINQLLPTMKSSNTPISLPSIYSPRPLSFRYLMKLKSPTTHTHLSPLLIYHQIYCILNFNFLWVRARCINFNNTTIFTILSSKIIYEQKTPTVPRANFTKKIELLTYLKNYRLTPYMPNQNLSNSKLTCT